MWGGPTSLGWCFPVRCSWAYIGKQAEKVTRSKRVSRAPPRVSASAPALASLSDGGWPESCELKNLSSSSCFRSQCSIPAKRNPARTAHTCTGKEKGGRQGRRTEHQEKGLWQSLYSNTGEYKRCLLLFHCCCRRKGKYLLVVKLWIPDQVLNELIQSCSSLLNKIWKRDTDRQSHFRQRRRLSRNVYGRTHRHKVVSCGINADRRKTCTCNLNWTRALQRFTVRGQRAEIKPTALMFLESGVLTLKVVSHRRTICYLSLHHTHAVLAVTQTVHPRTPGQNSASLRLRQEDH